MISHIKKKVYLHSELNTDTLSVHNANVEDMQKLEQFTKVFETVIFEDLEKMLMFYTQELYQIIAKWRKAKINLVIYKQKRQQLSKSVKEEQFSMLKDSFQILIQELKLLSDYISTNLEAFQKIIKKQNKVIKPFFPKTDLKARFEKCMLETKVFLMRDSLNNFLYTVESEYINFFYKDKNEGIAELRNISQGNLVSKGETFWFGLFSGFALLLVVVIGVIWWDDGIDVDEDRVFKDIFPIFRGIGLLILYMLLLAWNVYGWTKYHVNYKLIFRFNYHYSQFSQILRRAAVFSTILLILLFWYLILDGEYGDLANIFDFLPKEVIPLLLWISFVLYLVFPHKKFFNWPGRLFFFRLLKSIFQSPFVPVTFSIVWGTDQLTSFVLPLKDFEHTICYYIGYFFSGDSGVDHCHSNKRISKGVLIAVIPLILRILQCLRQLYDKKPNIRDPLLNCAKYSFSLLVSILSYLVSLHSRQSKYLTLWIVFAAISTVYSYYWDLKKDWGFLEPGSKYRLLRNGLSYRKPFLYYLAIFSNLIMRLAWVLSISPDVIAQIIRPELTAFAVGLLEIIRRSVWNFLRVEKEHLANVGSFRVVQDMRLPYDDIVFTDSTEEKLFSDDLEMIMEDSNKFGKPISNAGYVPYRTSIVTLAEKLARFGRKSTKISLKFLPEAEESPRLKNALDIPFTPAALAAMKEHEREELLKVIQKFREEMSNRFKIWDKAVKNFKQLLKKRADKYRIVLLDKEPEILRDISKKDKQKPFNRDQISQEKLHVDLEMLAEELDLKTEAEQLIDENSILLTQTPFNNEQGYPKEEYEENHIALVPVQNDPNKKGHKSSIPGNRETNSSIENQENQPIEKRKYQPKFFEFPTQKMELTENHIENDKSKLKTKTLNSNSPHQKRSQSLSDYGHFKSFKGFQNEKFLDASKNTDENLIKLSPINNQSPSTYSIKILTSSNSQKELMCDSQNSKEQMTENNERKLDEIINLDDISREVTEGSDTGSNENAGLKKKDPNGDTKPMSENKLSYDSKNYLPKINIIKPGSEKKKDQ